MISFAKKRRGRALPFVARGGLLAGAGLLTGAVLLLAPGALEAAQGQAAPATEAAARQMRHFWHVFAAYAIAWVLVFGWTVSIARRMRRVEERLTGR